MSLTINTFARAKKGHKYKAKKVVGEDGVVSDSKRELYMKEMLKLLGIPFVEKKKYVLQEKFRYMDEGVREMAMIPDFEIVVNEKPIAIVDVKGMVTPDWKLKCKLLKALLLKQNTIIPIFTPHTNKECDSVCNQLLDLMKSAK